MLPWDYPNNWEGATPDWPARGSVSLHFEHLPALAQFHLQAWLMVPRIPGFEYAEWRFHPLLEADPMDTGWLTKGKSAPYSSLDLIVQQKPP